MKTLTTTIAALAALAWLPQAFSASAIAQDRSMGEMMADTTLPFCKLGSNPGPCRLRPWPPPGWIPCQAGEHGCDTTYSRDRIRPEGWREATVTDALEELKREWETGVSIWNRPHHPAVAILRQASRPRALAELDAFADQVAAIAADATLPEHVRRNADLALDIAASSRDERGLEGTPYPRAFDLLVQVYEGGYHDALYGIWSADSVRGRAYVQDVFERSERPALCFYGHLRNPHVVEGRIVERLERGDPPRCPEDWRLDTPRRTPWCRAGDILFEDIAREARARTWPDGGPPSVGGEPPPVPDGLPEHVEDWHRRCK
ncbi:MAG: hypothetical protein J4F34_00765 [Gemmatimonadetes bacterium]|nr:hypothetical protein [Gemmatimonadota bacterium]